MRIFVKEVPRGQNCTLNVNLSTTVLDIKREIETILNIPIAKQKLVLLGRSLTDESALVSEIKIVEGSKLILVEKKPDLLRDIHRSFRRFYNEQQSEKLLQEFMADFDKSLQLLSYDDIERLAKNL